MLGCQRTRDLQRKIAKKENSRPQAKDLITESQVQGHLQSCRSDVHAVKECDYIEQEEKRQQPQSYASGDTLSIAVDV
jgi:hypothetical protein